MKFRAAMIASVLPAALFAAPVASQEAPTTELALDVLGLRSGTPVEVHEVTCAQVLSLDERHRGFAMVLLYGFAKGEQNQSVMSQREAQVAVINSLQECVDTPEARALSVLKSHIF